MSRSPIVFMVLMIACGGEHPSTETAVTATAATPAPAPPTPADAQRIIADSPVFSEYEFTNAAYSLPMQRSAMNEPARTAANDLRKAGWISFDGSGAVILAAKSKQDKRFLVRPNGFLDIVPLARKELGEVTAVRQGAEGIDADFTWKWIPNEVGQAFRSGAVHDRYAAPQKATATLIHDGTSWTVLRIKAQE